MALDAMQVCASCVLLDRVKHLRGKAGALSSSRFSLASLLPLPSCFSAVSALLQSLTLEHMPLQSWCVLVHLVVT